MLKGLLFLWRFGLKTDKKYIFCGIALQLVRAIIPLASVIFPKYIVDELVGAGRPERLLILTGAYLSILLISNCLSSYLLLTGFNGRIRVANAFTLFMNRKLARADYERIQDPGFLDVKTRAEKFLTADWHGSFYLLDEALSLIGQAFTLAGVVAIVITLDLAVLAILLALIIVQAGVDAWAKKKEIGINLRFAEYSRRGMYYDSLFQDAKYAKELRVNVLGDWLLGRQAKLLEKEADFYRERNAFYIKTGVLGALSSFFQQCAAYAYVIWRTLAGLIGIGDFFMYTGAVATFSSSMRSIINSFVWIKSYGKYYDALDEYMNIPDNMRGGSRPIPAAPYTFAFEGVGYRYPGQESWALREINLVIESGEKLSIVGENGAGKTTFVKLMTRLYDPDEGRVTLNGVDIREYDYDEYMALFGAVFQDFQLFAFTLGENVILTEPERSKDAGAEVALERAGMSERLSTLADGLYTMVGRQFDAPADFPPIYRQKQAVGFEPSGGEAQKIALARALYRDAPVAILDEPTAALDPRAEYGMYQQFDAMVAGKTAVYVSHRMSSARFCDRIAVFDGGSIIELGTHDELMRLGGRYAELYSMQSKYYVE